MRIAALLCASVLVLAGCPDKPKPGPQATSSAAPSASSAAAPAVAKPSLFSGASIARTPADDALVIADEDHDALRVIALPFDGTAPPAVKEIALQGHPVQVLALGDRVLATVRDPAALVVLKVDAAKGLVETARTTLPGDAWGIAVARDEKLALVSSAWTHKVSAVDLATMKVKWTVDVPREPRAIVVRSDDKSAYVTHLVGSGVTRIDGIDGEPKVTTIDLPPAPARSIPGRKLDASLAYSAVLSSDGSRLFVARHALGAIGHEPWGAPWFGASTVDVLLTATDKPLLANRTAGLPKAVHPDFVEMGDAALPSADASAFVQPRAMALRASTSTLLVASEGGDAIVELDALAVAPGMMPIETYSLAKYEKVAHVASEGGAPSGIVLSRDESKAFVWCRSTGDVAVVRLAAAASEEKTLDAGVEDASAAASVADASAADASAADASAPDAGPPPPRVRVVHLADDTLDREGALGRRLFFNASDAITSGGLACNACHPEGRDDGHVWHQVEVPGSNDKEPKTAVFVGEPENAEQDGKLLGVPRQTPMLAGRVGANGPYGWTAQSKDLPERLYEGFRLHRWSGDTKNASAQKHELVARAQYLQVFAKKGLVTPPRDQHELTEQEQLGRKIFTSPEANCSKCHDPNQGEYTDRAKYPLASVLAPPGFDDEKPYEFRTPSLRFVGGTAPYFHDGHAATLEALVDGNNDRMGKTNHLSKEERAALVAFLRTL